MADTDPNTRPHNPYARFIPREELKGFAAWTPGSFGDAQAAAQPDLSAAPEAPPEPPPPTTEEWEARVQEAREAGYHDGYRDGLEALEAAKRQYAQQVSAQVGTLVTQMQDELKALEDQMAQSVLDTAVRLARQVVRSELVLRPDAVAQVAREAVSAVLLSAQRLRLRMNPDDLALVKDGAAEVLASREVMLQADPEVSRGGCVVDTDMGGVDAQIEARWAQAAGLFGLPIDWATPAPAGVVAPEPTPPSPTEEARP